MSPLYILRKGKKKKDIVSQKNIIIWEVAAVRKSEGKSHMNIPVARENVIGKGWAIGIYFQPEKERKSARS